MPVLEKPTHREKSRPPNRRPFSLSATVIRNDTGSIPKQRPLFRAAFQIADKVISGIFLAPPGRNLTFLHLV